MRSGVGRRPVRARHAGRAARAGLRGALALAALAAQACGAAETRGATVAPARASDAGAPPQDAPPPPPSYVLGELAGRALLPIPLDRADVVGAVQDGLRVVSTAGGLRAARELADPPLLAAERVPRWLGGGFLFRSTSALYASDTFDGALRSILTLPSPIERVAFGPKFLLVRASNGERWALELPSGKRVAIAPLGLADVAALPGRAAALTDAGGVLVSTDGGEKWTDATAQIRGRADRVVVLEDAVWIVEAGGPAWRVDDGRLVAFDRAPAVKPPELRPRDARWRSDEPVLRRAIRLGAVQSERSALLVSDGDVVRVDTATGELLSVLPGRLPPDATCEAIKADGDVLFACTRAGGQGAFVATRSGGDKAPVVEQTFAAPGQLYASDDGALAFGGPCARAKASRGVVCVRMAGGAWQELDVEGLAADAGAPLDVVRWIPRADGAVFGFVAGAQPALVDARTGELRAWRADMLTSNVRSAFTGGRGAHVGRVVDRTWSATPGGGLAGWTESGAAIDVSPEGVISVSPFTFDRVATYARYALARTREGRFWQTVDRGASWAEIAAPPTSPAGRGAEPRLCSSVGCDLGAWYRVGWPEVPPAPVAAPVVAAPPERLARAPLPALGCRRVGEARLTAVARASASPEDLGLGAATLPVSRENGTSEVLRTALSRAALVPPHGGTDARDTDYAAPRLVVHGPQTEAAGEDRFVALAPNKDPLALRRALSFVLPFDPKAAVRGAQIGTSDALAAGRVTGQRAADVLREDTTALAAVALVTPLDPTAPGELVASSPLGLLAVLRGGAPSLGRVALRVRPSDDAVVLSAAQLGKDEYALLEVDPSGKGLVFKVGPSGASDLFEVAAPPRAGLYPANADAVAIGLRGEIATLRTPSGGEPPSAFDPAVLMLPGAPPSALAPWSTLETADSPACRADASGFRATLAVLRPWLRLAGDARAEEDAPMFARVRWSAARVCLEAVEVRITDSDVRVAVRDAPRERGARGTTTPVDAQIETWLVARFTGVPEAARVAIAPGIELRQTMTCTTTP